jgi:hypothetical protein
MNYVKIALLTIVLVSTQVVSAQTKEIGESEYASRVLFRMAQENLDAFVRVNGKLKKSARYPIATQPKKLSLLVPAAFEKMGMGDDKKRINRFQEMFDAKMIHYASDSTGLAYCVGYDAKKKSIVDQLNGILEGFSRDFSCPFHLVPPAMRGSTYVWIGNSIQRQYPYVRDMRGKMDGKYTDEWAE